MVCLLNSCLYVMFCAGTLFWEFGKCCADQIGARLALQCATPRIAAHRTYMGSCGEKITCSFLILE